MVQNPINALFSKVRRAEKHIADLNAEIKGFLSGNPYRIVGHLNAQKSERIWRIHVNSIPFEISNIAADAIHNLRTPLDKMLTDGAPRSAIHLNKPDIATIKFPFFDHVNESRKFRERLEKNFTAGVVKFLLDREPYRGGEGSVLWAINHLDNRDKHRSIVAPISTGFGTTQVHGFSIIGGKLLRMGSRKGKHMVAHPNGSGDLIAESDTLAPIYRLNPVLASPGYLEFTSPHDDMEVCTTTPGGKLNADIKPSLAIAFSNIAGFEGEPIIQSLDKMRQAVIATIESFSAKFY